MPEVAALRFRALPRADGHGQLPWGSPEIALAFDATGIVLSGQRPGERMFIPWASVTRVTRGASEAAFAGGSVTVVGIESAGRVLELSVRSTHRDPVALGALTDRVAAWSPPTAAISPPARPVPPAPAAPSWPLAVPSGPSGPNGLPAALPLTWGYGPPWSPGSPAAAPGRRSRRIGLLVGAIAFLGAGVGLAFALSGSDGPRPTAAKDTPPPTPDQALADRLMLTRADLPAGWSVGNDNGGQSSSPKVQAGEARITRVFARCMGITENQAATTLGGGAPDQTAQSSSSRFVGPPASGQPGFTLELQTGASIVRSHGDEQTDFGLFANPRFPTCVGAAFASETQLGANSSSGGSGQPGQPSVSAVDLQAPPGEQVSGLLVSFTVSDGSASVPVEIETVSLGHDRIEANFQALAIGGLIPAAAVASPLSVFAERVAGGGQIAEA